DTPCPRRFIFLFRGNKLYASREGHLLRQELAAKQEQRRAREEMQEFAHQNSTPIITFIWSAVLYPTSCEVRRCLYSPENNRSDFGRKITFAIPLRFAASTYPYGPTGAAKAWTSELKGLSMPNTPLNSSREVGENLSCDHPPAEFKG